MSKYWKKGVIHIALLGMENQTDTDADMPLRVINYDGAAYRNQLNANKANLEAGRPKERYPVVTLVLYTLGTSIIGRSTGTSWTASTSRMN